MFVVCLGVCLAGEGKLGKPLTLKQQTSIAEIGANPAAYVGKLVQVKGKVTDLCQKAGCWMNLVDPAGGAPIRIKESGELIDREPGFSNQRPQGPFGKLFVIRNGQSPARRGRVPQDDAAFVLPVDFVSDSAQRPDRVAAGDNRELHPPATSMTSSSMLGGTLHDLVQLAPAGLVHVEVVRQHVLVRRAVVGAERVQPAGHTTP